LRPLATYSDSSYEGIALSSDTVKTVNFQSVGFMAWNDINNRFEYADGRVLQWNNLSKDHYIWVDYWYVDGDVTITGKAKQAKSDLYLPLKKGWNAIHHAGDSTYLDDPGKVKWVWESSMIGQ